VRDEGGSSACRGGNRRKFDGLDHGSVGDRHDAVGHRHVPRTLAKGADHEGRGGLEASAGDIQVVQEDGEAQGDGIAAGNAGVQDEEPRGAGRSSEVGTLGTRGIAAEVSALE
jgi:hypothetical protein